MYKRQPVMVQVQVVGRLVPDSGNQAQHYQLIKVVVVFMVPVVKVAMPAVEMAATVLMA